MPTLTDETNWVETLGLSERGSPEFFRTLEELDSSETIMPQAHVIRRAWQDMDLDGVLCLDGVPSIYFKEVDVLQPEEVRGLHQQLWNQGVAPTLFIISKTDVRILSGLTLPAREDKNIYFQNRLVEVFDRYAEALEIRKFIRSYELGEIFRLYSDSFDPKNRVDRYLLDNLDAARSLLTKAVSNKLNTQTVHALLGRVIFTCYLVDRKIIGSTYLADSGAINAKTLLDVLSGKDSQHIKDVLYNLFTRLQIDFNGDVFNGDLEEEKNQIESEHLDILWRFLNGDKLDDEQVSLGFWAYDFGIIPVETISGIYESFLQVESSNTDDKRNKGVYYTPRFLAEVVIDTALDGFDTLLGKRFLDPACGSGIFLVGIFNRMAEEWRRRNLGASNAKRAGALIDILLSSLFGIDESPVACRISAFSLYLALLDHLSPRDIQELQNEGRKLPTLVVQEKDEFGPQAGSNILPRDFFDGSLATFAEQNSYFPVSGFDLIIGNPPWVREKSKKKSTAEKWCDDRALIYPQRQIASCFVWKALNHVMEGGQICFLLPATLLFGYSKILTFQKEWFSKCVIERVMNLADMGFYLFENANHPTIVVKYKNQLPDLENYFVQYLTPKTEMETLRAEMLVISPEDQKEISLTNEIGLLKRNKASTIWKELFWGTPRDRKFIQRLFEYERLEIWENRKEDEWVIHEGFNAGGDGEPVERPVLKKLPFLRAGQVSPYVICEDKLQPFPPVTDPRRMSSEKVFRSPHLVFPHGVDRKGKKIKVGYCSKDYSFTHSLRGIHAPIEQEAELRFLTCVLASPLALYYFFHSTTNWGIERPDILVVEYRNFPFPKPVSSEKKDIVRDVAILHKKLELIENESHPLSELASLEKERCILEIDQLVNNYYDIDSLEEILISDTVNILIPSATPRRNDLEIKTLLPSNEAERIIYLNVILGTLNSWANKNGNIISGSIIDSVDEGLGLVSLTLNSTDSDVARGESENAIPKLSRVLDRINRLLPRKMTSIRFQRNLKVFDGNNLYILKPLSNRYWTRTVALNDADEIASAIFVNKS